jgi:hypothetical protein
VAKTIPVYKNKGNKKDVESYRPIANLCSTSKVFEKLILKHIREIQDKNECDITGQNQHGFKCKRSTSTLSSQLKSIIVSYSWNYMVFAYRQRRFLCAIEFLNDLISGLVKRLRKSDNQCNCFCK